MNIKNFSLDYIQPSSGTRGPAPVIDAWVDAVNYYRPHILRILQQSGHTRVQDLFDTVRTDLNVKELQLDQFIGIIDRMILNRQITVVQTGPTPGEAIIALPVPA